MRGLGASSEVHAERQLSESWAARGICGGATAGVAGLSGSEEDVLRRARTSSAKKHLILQRAHLLDRGIPLVANARSLSPKSASYVDVDNEQGSYLAVRHLLDKGCQVVATVAPHQGISPGVDRLNGYRRALADAGREHGDDLVRFGDFSTESGRQLTAELLAARPDIDGLFVAGQLMSYGALRALREAGRRVPTDLAVVGFDDLPGAESTDPPLTSIHQPVEQIGRELARLLIAEISDGTPSRKRVILDTELVERESSQLGQP